MKKIILGLFVFSFCFAANAASTSSTLSLNGSLSSSCTSGFNNGTLSFTFVPGAQVSAQNTVYTLTCTAGSVIGAFTATSANGWRFVGANSGDVISYNLTATTASPYTSAVTGVWSGATGSTTSENLLSSGSITINGSASPLISTLTISPDTTPVASNVDSYSDTVTIATAY